MASDAVVETKPGRTAIPYREREVVLQGESLQVTYNRLAVAIDGVSLPVPAASIVATLRSKGGGNPPRRDPRGRRAGQGLRVADRRREPGRHPDQAWRRP